jgi:hypothetical protein
MDDYYYFFDRSAVDSLWKMSWKEFLRLHGNSDWAKYPEIGSADGSLRGLIAFALDPEPSAAEVEDIIHRRTVRGTIERSSPQFYVIGRDCAPHTSLAEVPHLARCLGSGLHLHLADSETQG